MFAHTLAKIKKITEAIRRRTTQAILTNPDVTIEEIGAAIAAYVRACCQNYVTLCVGTYSGFAERMRVFVVNVVVVVAFVAVAVVVVDVVVVVVVVVIVVVAVVVFVVVVVVGERD